MAATTVFEKAARGLAALFGVRSYEIPEWMAPSLAKAAQHKYIRRVPKPGGKGYRYYYTVTGGHGLGHHGEFQTGAAFRMADKGKEGHFHVSGVHDDDHVTVKHDETGTEHRLHKDALSAMLRNEHAAAITTAENEAAEKREAAKKRALKDLAEAREAGSEKHVARAKAEAVKHGASEDETLSPAEREQRQKAAEESARKRRKAEEPESKPAPSKSEDEKPSAPKGEHQRVGSHVGGAKRDLAQLSREQVAALSPDEARRLVTKAKAYQAPTPEQAKEQGWSHGGYALWKSILGMMGAAPPEPVPYTEEAAKQARQDYLDAIDHYAKMFASGGSSLIDVIKAASDAKRETSWGAAPPMGVQTAVREAMQTYGKRTYKFGKQTVTSSGHPGDVRVAILGPRFQSALHQIEQIARGRVGGDKSVVNALYEAAKAEKAGWPEATTEAEKPEAPSRERLIFSRKVADKPERIGGRPVESASPEALQKEFGLHEVDFGNWVNQEDRWHHVRWAHSALRDLEDIIGLPSGMAALAAVNGKSGRNPLALAFGARGTGGTRAQYEPFSRDEKTRTITPTINLTRYAGGGSLAHEWGHFLDNVLAEAHHKGENKGLPVFLSDDAKVRAGLAPEIRQPMDALMREIRNGPYADHANALGTYYAKPVEMFARAFESYIQDKLASQGRKNSYLVDGTHLRYKTGKDVTRSHEDMMSEPEYAAAMKARKEAEDAHYSPARSEHVRKYLEAEHAKNPRRKFESVFRDHFHAAGDSWDKTPEGAASNERLKQAQKAVDEAVKKVGRTEQAQPYPQGEQRKRINAAFDALMGAIAAGKHLEKAMTCIADARAAFALEILFKAATITPWVEIPEDLALGLLAKARTHKYIKRVPIEGRTNKSGGPVYRYFYKVTSGTAAAEHFKVGASFADKKIGEHGGHWHIHGKSGDKLHLRHDETGEERHVTSAELASMLHEAHGIGAHDKAKRDKALADLKAARDGGASARTVEAAKKRAIAAGASDADVAERVRVKSTVKPPRAESGGASERVRDSAKPVEMPPSEPTPAPVETPRPAAPRDTFGDGRWRFQEGDTLSRIGPDGAPQSLPGTVVEMWPKFYRKTPTGALVDIGPNDFVSGDPIGSDPSFAARSKSLHESVRKNEDARSAKIAEQNDRVGAIRSAIAGAKILGFGGKTFDAKDALKDLGAKWDAKAKAWTLDVSSMKPEKLAAELDRLNRSGVTHHIRKGGAGPGDAFLRNALEAAALTRALNQR